MKKFKKNSVATVLVVLFTLGLAGMAMAVTPQPKVNLGGAASFAILAGTPNITETGGHTSAVTGNVGLSPASAAGIQLYCAQVTGLIYGVNTAYVGNGIDTSCFHGTAPDKTLVDNAKIDLTAAYTDAAGRIPVNTIGTELGGQTLLPGVYASGATTFGITAGAGHLILDGQGNPDAVFIFEVASAAPGLVVGPGSVVELTGQAQACNVFWRVDTATINTTAKFKGSILALNSITVASGADIEGRLLARNGNVTLDNAKIVVPTCTSAYTLHVFKQVVNTGGGTAVPSDFSLHVKLSGTDVTGSPQPGDSSGTSYALVPSSTYVVSENTHASYTQSFSGDCDSSGSVTLAADGKTCTITNTYVPPVAHSVSIAPAPATLHVIKHVVNSGGGTATASSFAIHVKIPVIPVASDVIGSPAAGVEAPGTSYRLSVGTYIVSEDANASYTQSFSGDCDSSGSVTLSTGADKTCTITNAYKPLVAAVVVPTPKLPNTGLPPYGTSTPLDAALAGGILMMVLASLAIVQKKRKI